MAPSGGLNRRSELLFEPLWSIIEVYSTIQQSKELRGLLLKMCFISRHDMFILRVNSIYKEKDSFTGFHPVLHMFKLVKAR